VQKRFVFVPSETNDDARMHLRAAVLVSICALHERRKRFSDLGWTIFLNEMDSFDGNFLLVRPGAAEVARAPDQ
jgi:hypothetical protein